jgi:hypothetical protein
LSAERNIRRFAGLARLVAVTALVAAACGQPEALRTKVVSGGPDGATPQDGAAPDTPTGTVDSSMERQPTGLVEGSQCTAAAACASGFCVDGVCCTSACAGTCMTCAAAGSLGTCTQAEVGTDPRDECPDETAATCGRDGVCDGAGACRKYAQGTICAAPSCTDST